MNEQSQLRKFPRVFWTANTVELFERAAYYAMASFMVIYLHENLGMSPSLATFLNGSLLWGMIYFLPILSGTLADKFGFRRSLSAAFVMIALGYVILGNLKAFWSGDYAIPVIAGICLIGVGGSVVKPCIAGTVQKSAGQRATLAFGIFYMIINIGSISGRLVSYFIRTRLGIPAIFKYPSTIFALIGLAATLVVYREPGYAEDAAAGAVPAPRRTLGQALAGIFMLVSIASMAVGEMMASPRIYEYIGAIAPRGQEGLYFGYTSLPIALASIVGGPIGGRLFERYVSGPLAAGRPVNALPMWLIIVGVGAASVVGLLVYDRLIMKGRERSAA